MLIVIMKITCFNDIEIYYFKMKDYLLLNKIKLLVKYESIYFYFYHGFNTICNSSQKLL